MLSNFKHNPDLMLYRDKSATELEMAEIPENPRSAPPKDSISNQQLLQLRDHEELFFHYLSILAILPTRRQDFL